MVDGMSAVKFHYHHHLIFMLRTVVGRPVPHSAGGIVTERVRGYRCFVPRVSSTCQDIVLILSGRLHYFVDNFEYNLVSHHGSNRD